MALLHVVTFTHTNMTMTSAAGTAVYLDRYL